MGNASCCKEEEAVQAAVVANRDAHFVVQKIHALPGFPARLDRDSAARP